MQNLRQLARFLQPLESAGFVAGKWSPSEETSPGMMTFPYVLYGDLTKEFLQYAYDDGWVMMDFDWPTWIATQGAKTLGAAGAGLEQASPLELAKVLTAIIRQDRFMEGALLEAFRSGLIVGVVRRAATLAKAAPPLTAHHGAQMLGRFVGTITKDDNTTALWDNNNPVAWETAASGYFNLVPKANLLLEQSLENMGVEPIAVMSAAEWFAFLYHKYFVWKYTAKNRLATSRKALDRWVEKNGLDALDDIRRRLIALDPSIGVALATAKEIGGLGVAGASGLLSLMYPERFGTVDQFVVKALRQIEHLPEAEELAVMNPESLTLVDGVILTKILRRKAAEIGGGWTPRKVDAALWFVGRIPSERKAAEKNRPRCP